MSEPAKTVAEVLKAGSEFLAKNRVEEPRAACELLLGRLLGCRRLDVHTKSEQVLGEKHLEAMRRGIKRVAAGEPVQYILGQVEFMGRVFKVDKRALIPRPETELLVEEVLACDTLWAREKPTVIDWGTGSGCIVLSLALAKPQGLYLAVDASPEAMALARENAAALGLADKIGFVDSDISDLVEPETIDAIVANLPYVPTSEWERLPVHIRDHEPRQALDGGPRGLSVIESVVQDASMVLKPRGMLFLEIGYQQGPAVKSLLAETGFSDVEVKKDVAGHDRIVTAALGEP